MRRSPLAGHVRPVRPVDPSTRSNPAASWPNRCTSGRARGRFDGVAVDPPEAERLVTDVELFEAREARPYDDVTFLEVLRRAGSLGKDRTQAIAGVPAQLLEPFVRPRTGEPAPPGARGVRPLESLLGRPPERPNHRSYVAGRYAPCRAHRWQRRWSRYRRCVPANDSAFLRACRGEPTSRVPVWFMRQAGRSLPEYRAARGSGSILDALADPELAAELTLQPVRRYGVDAAILFSDIVVPAAAVGFGVEIRAGVGPVVEKPFRGPDDLDRLRPLRIESDVPHVIETVRLASRALEPLGVPLIGFAGGPFTVASYLIEGGPSRDLREDTELMRGDTQTWSKLLERLADHASAMLRAQVEAGAQRSAAVRQLGRGPRRLPTTRGS